MAQPAARETCVVYCRVSSKKQRDDETIAAQRERCALLVQRYNLDPYPYGPDLAGYLEDNGLSGTLLAGRALAGFIDDLDKQRIKPDYLIVYNLSRVCRVDKYSSDVEKQKQSAKDAAEIATVLRVRGIKVIDEEGINDPTQLGFELKMMIGNEGYKTLRKTTTDAKVSRLEKGSASFGGQAPYGYDRELTNGVNRKEGWRLIAVPEEGERLRQIYEWYAEGGATYAAQQATEDEIPGPRGDRPPRKNAVEGWTSTTWSRVTVEKLAGKAATYLTGVLESTFDGKPYRVEAEPLIGHALYQRVVTRRNAKTLKHPASQLGTGYLRCAGCIKAGRRNVGVRYSEGTVNWFVRCDRCRRNVYAVDFDRCLREAIDCRLIQHALHTKAERGRGDHAERIKAVDAQLDEVRRQLVLASKLVLNRQLPEDVWAEQNAELVTERLRLQGERERLKADAEAAKKRELQEELLTDRVAQLLAERRDGDLGAQRKILASLLGDESRITVSWETDEEGKTYAAVTLPALGTLAPQTYRTGQPVADQIWTEAERSSPQWPEVLAEVETHGLREALDQLFAAEMPPEWGPAPKA